ncbi:hypothetical protein THAOC_11925, partial [Thalassiosira oceanica]
SLLQSVDDVEIPSADLQCQLPMSEFQVWSKVIRSCGLSLEVEADSPQPAIEFSRNRAIERPWDVWIRKFIHFFYQRNNNYLSDELFSCVTRTIARPTRRGQTLRYRTIASRATDRPTESLNPVAAVSTEDIIANRAAPPPGPSPPPGGGGAVRIRDIQFPATSAARKSDTRLRKNCS